MDAPQLISLGEDCHVSLQLRRFQFRQQAFPLDWVGTYDMGVVCRLFQTRFAGFTDREPLVYDAEFHKKQPWLHTVLRHKDLGVVFGHDYMPQDLGPDGVKPEAHVEVKAKYDKRIERLYSTLGGGGRVIFCRKQVSPTDQIARFDALLRDMYPLLDVRIMVYGFGGDELVYCGRSGRVKSYRMPWPGKEGQRFYRGWVGFSEAIRNAFEADA